MARPGSPAWMEEGHRATDVAAGGRARGARVPACVRSRIAHVEHEASLVKAIRLLLLPLEEELCRLVFPRAFVPGLL
eukprot:6650841-Pyramimonas_sp.AAC.1